MCIDQLPLAMRQQRMRTAFLEHYLRWIDSDGEDYHQIHQVDGGVLTATVLRRIAKRYWVNRGIRRAPEGIQGDPIAEELAEILTQASPGLANRPIPIRWNATQIISENCRAAMQAYFPNHVRPIISGVTKLTWFLAPHGWTMFDRLARIAVGVGQMNAEQQAEAFYAQLVLRGFPDHVDNVNQVMAQHGFQHLFGERVIDKLLMLVALPHPDVARWDLRSQQFLAALHPQHATEVEACADALAALVDDQFMIANP